MENRQPILKHADIWRAIDRLAAKHGISTSGLARRAGLDPTSFNKSKRVLDDGKRRWPNTASLAKILNATSTPLSTFVALIEEGYPPGVPRRLPALPITTAQNGGHFDAEGKATMVDVSEKDVTDRIATAKASVLMQYKFTAPATRLKAKHSGH